MSEEKKTQETEITVKKLTPFFIDEIANISISPNGACRLQFATWQTTEKGEPLRLDSEVILTAQTLRMLSDSLPKAIEKANQFLAQNSLKSETKDSLQ